MLKTQSFETVAEKYSCSDVSTLLITDERYLQWSHQKAQRITNHKGNRLSLPITSPDIDSL